MDCHAQWHALHEEYFSPEGFRLALNSFLQTHRSVTGLLLKLKGTLPGFNEWFTHFSEGADKSEIMRWAKKSRNRIVHESDLELNSSCQVIWIGDWYRRSEAVAKFPPRMTVDEMIDAIRQSRGAPPFGTVTVKRRWVDKALPDWELLEATADTYMELNRLLRAGHLAAGVENCPLDSGHSDCITAELPEASGHLSCMHAARSELSGHFSVRDGRVLMEVTEQFEMDEERGRASFEEIGLPEFPRGDAIACVPGYMEVARRLMQRDGFHATMAVCYKGDAVVRIQGMQFPDQATKLLSFERLANLIESLRADGVLIIGEMWTSVQTEAEKRLGTVLLPARDRLDKREALTVYAITRDGRHADLVCFVERTPSGDVICGDPFALDVETGANTVIPIRRKWKEMEARGL
ncbi:hypothetical protein ACWC98_17210 [Streptomyces goshikiensis]